jgi:hypothetical protein
MVDLSTADDPSSTLIDQRVIGDLISYQNDGKACTAITGKVESMSEYSSSRTDARADEALISAIECVCCRVRTEPSR